MIMTSFDVVLTTHKGRLIVVDGPPRIIQGTTFVRHVVLPERGSCYAVESQHVAEFFRQLVVSGFSFAFDGGE